MLIGAFGEVNETMLAVVGEKLIEAVVNKDDVTVLISTYGGELYPALAIYDLIRVASDAGSRVTTVAIGACMSAGMVILQAGDRRGMTENSQLMTHYGEDGAEDVGDAKQNRYIHELHKKLVGNKSSVTKRTINSWYHKNTYFNAAKALEAGLIDEVVSYGS